MFRESLFSALIATIPAALAEEGMWTFDTPPVEAIRSACGFQPDQAWLDRLRLSTVRFGETGSGAFVGHSGLVLTNQHVAHAHLQRISTSERDLVNQGFVAKSHEQELRVPGLTVRVLSSTKNITVEVEKAVSIGMSQQQAESARQNALEEIRRGETMASGLTCETVELHEGSEYWIHRYRVFQDVRLVMVPEHDVAAFGKDWDNFTYPRHDLDFALFRVYENELPLRPFHALDWSLAGIPYDGVAIVAGYPGRTHRWETSMEMDFRGRVTNPLMARTLERKLGVLTSFAKGGETNARLVSADIQETSNFLKVYREEVRGLRAPDALERTQARERALLAQIAQSPKWRDTAGKSWRSLPLLFQQKEQLAKEHQLLHRAYRSLERGALELALQLVRHITEYGKPEARRLPGHPDSAHQAMQSLFMTSRQLNRPLEEALLTSGLAETLDWLGKDHLLPKALMNGRAPGEVAKQAIRETRIDDPEFVRILLDGGPAALAQCADPLLKLAVSLDPRSREIRQKCETLEARIQEQTSLIAKARLILMGKTPYPDADATLRLSYGRVRAYEAEGTLQQPFTTYGGLFDRADAWGPTAENGSWALPPRWHKRRKTLEPSTPLNFITTNDITGGSSGSPVVDAKGELVGLVFDGNIHSIPGRFLYDERRNRCIAVDVRGILEALRKLYDAPHLIRELTER